MHVGIARVGIARVKRTGMASSVPGSLRGRFWAEAISPIHVEIASASSIQMQRTKPRNPCTAPLRCATGIFDRKGKCDGGDRASR